MMSELAFELRGGLLSAEVESRNFIPHGRMADQMTDDVMTDDHTDHTLSWLRDTYFSLALCPTYEAVKLKVHSLSFWKVSQRDKA